MSSDTNIEITAPATDVTIKLDSVELERTMMLSNEELKKAVKQANSAAEQKENNQHTNSDSTSFFSLSKTSAFSSLFEKKRNVDTELARSNTETSIDPKEIGSSTGENTVLPHIEDSFNIISRIGEGGQGVVSTAADRALGRIIALKSLHDKLNCKAESREHFVAEAKITAQLDYPGIVPVYSLNSDKDNGLHLAMKLINGENLADYLDRIKEQYTRENVNKFNENLSMRKRLDIFLRTCNAMAYAHSRNVMHCDLKPENIMLGQYNDSYIMDWGIAKLIQDPSFDPEKWQRPSSIAGTPRYLSPEAIDGLHVDERADIYALGLILFECVFLKCAYSGKDTKEVIAKIKNGEIEKFSHKFNISVSKDLCAIIRKAVAHDRDKRYQSVTVLAEDVRKYLAHEETTARPDNIFRKLFRFCQNHIKVLLILFLLGILLAGASLSYSVYQRNRHANIILQREVALSTAYSKALYVSSLIEMQMNNVSSTLKAISAYISFLLEHDTQAEAGPKKYFLVPEEAEAEQRASDIKFFAPVGRFISLERLAFNHPSGKFDAKMLEVINKIQTLQPAFKKALLNGNVFNENLRDMSEKEVEKYYFEKGAPILWLHCGFANGLSCSMPGYLQEKSSYDPRQRSWYKNAAKQKNSEVFWGAPYPDIISRKITLTASVPIFADDKLYGVIAADNTLSYIAHFMKRHGNKEAFLLEKIITDKNGDILLSTKENYFDKMKNQPQTDSTKFFEKQDIFDTIRERRNGMFTIHTSNGRNIIYLFYKIESRDWHYIEKLDLDMLIEHIAAQKKK